MANNKKPKRFTMREIQLLCLLLLIVAVFIFIAGRQKWEWWEPILGNGFTFVTSIICSILATTLLPKILQSPTKEDIRNVFCEETKRLEEITEMKRLATPDAVYMDTNDPNPEFNDILNKSIMKSEEFIYFSDRAMYTAKRLIQDIDPKYTNSKLKIVILVVDIREDNLFKARKDVFLSRERKKPNGTIRRNFKEIINDEKKDILSSIYALSQLRSIFDITIYLHRELPFFRVEITDTILVITFLNKISTGKKHPTTALYENENIFKPNYEEYIKEVITRAYKLSDNDLTLNGLLALAKEAGVNCNADDIDKYYKSLY